MIGLSGAEQTLDADIAVDEPMVCEVIECGDTELGIFQPLWAL
jgi:hypothetical protein